MTPLLPGPPPCYTRRGDPRRDRVREIEIEKCLETQRHRETERDTHTPQRESETGRRRDPERQRQRDAERERQ